MSFWSAETAEPLRQFRWYMIFGGDTSATDGLQGIVYALKKTDKPKAKVGTVQHKYMNHYFNYPGRLEWEDINVTFAAVAKPNGSNVLFNILRQAGYGVPDLEGIVPGDSNFATIGKRKMVSAIGSIDLIQMDPDGNTREKWTIKNPLFTSVQFGALDYGSEEIVEISATIKYDWAYLAETDEEEDDALAADGERPDGPTDDGPGGSGG